MFDLLCKFENIVVLKTIMDSIDLNFIGTEDLERIADDAENLGIDLNCIDLDNIYDSEYDLIEDIYKEWFDDVNTMYLDIKEELLKLI